jgi:hypothetical protein
MLSVVRRKARRRRTVASTKPALSAQQLLEYAEIVPFTGIADSLKRLARLSLLAERNLIIRSS